MDPVAIGSITGVEADVILAAYYAAEVAAKTIKAGNTNTQVRERAGGGLLRNFWLVCESVRACFRAFALSCVCVLSHVRVSGVRALVCARFRVCCWDKWAGGRIADVRPKLTRSAL